MKIYILLFLSFSIYTRCFCQELTGEWNAKFKDRHEAISIPPIPIKLKFSWTSDSSYNILSFTPGFEYKNGKHDTVICSVIYKMLEQDSIYLEETKIIKSEKDTSACFMKMYLKIKRDVNNMAMSGTWETKSKECSGEGQINFIKKP